MKFRVLKELRENGPVAVLVVVGMLVANVGLPPEIARPVLVVAGLFGSAFLGAMPFAREFAHGDGAWFLAQPVSRVQLWLEKWLVSLVLWLGVWLPFEATVAAAFPAAEYDNLQKLGSALVLAVYGCAPLMALLARGAVPSLVLAIGAPIVGLIAYLLGCGSIGSAPREEVFVPLSLISGCVLLVAALLAFRACEAKPTFMMVSVELPAAMRPWGRKKKPDPAAFTGTGRPWAALVKKDLRLVAPYLVLSVLATVGVLGISLTPLAQHELAEGAMFTAYVLLAGLLPFLAATALAMGDRAPGVREQGMCLPVSIKAQFFVKSGIVLAMSVLFSGLLFSETALGLSRESGSDRAMAAAVGGVFVLASMVVGNLIAFYAATTAKSAICSLPLAYALMFGMAGIYLSGAATLSELGRLDGSPQRVVFLVCCGVVPACLFAWLAYRNMRQIRTLSEIRRQYAALCVVGAAVFGLSWIVSWWSLAGLG